MASGSTTPRDPYEVLGVQRTAGEAESKEAFRVYADPAGHPFCLCRIDAS